MNAGAIGSIVLALVGGADPFADTWISYDAGSNAAPGYTDPAVAIGSPERFTGEGVFPGAVSAFNPPFGTDEIVSIGTGGHLVVRFDEPVRDDPHNPFGIDLLVFANAGFIDAAFPGGVVGGLFGADGGVVELSADGKTWVAAAGVAADGMFPTDGWLDTGPYDAEPGTAPADFTRPVDPALALGDFMALDNDQVRALYDGSGGGVGIDVGAAGLAAVTHVRITNPGVTAIEIDALSDVADPADVDRDGVVGVDDFLAVLAAWGACPKSPQPCPADADRDGTVGVGDFLLVLAHWTP